MYSSGGDGGRSGGCGCGGTVGLYASNGDPVPGTQSLYDQAAGTVLEAAGDWLTGQSRRGGADPCCPPGYDPEGVWPRNSGVEGAPPDYRQRGSPMEDTSPSGVGRKKDDFCDCIPIRYGSGYYMLGEIRNGVVYPGTPTNRDAGVWVEVTAEGRPVRVPGHGDVELPASSGGSGGGSWSDPGPYAAPTGATLPTWLALGLLGAGGYVALRKRRR